MVPTQEVRYAPLADINPLFDHLVGAGQQHRRKLKAERLGGFLVYSQFKFGGLLDRQVDRLGAS